jgi:hypothetical protein
MPNIKYWTSTENMSGFSGEGKSLQYLSQYSLKKEMSLRKIEEEKCLIIMSDSLSYL